MWDKPLAFELFMSVGLLRKLYLSPELTGNPSRTFGFLLPFLQGAFICDDIAPMFEARNFPKLHSDPRTPTPLAQLEPEARLPRVEKLLNCLLSTTTVDCTFNT